MIGRCCVKHWSKTQSTISLSSGEAELHGITQGSAQALGVTSHGIYGLVQQYQCTF